MKKAVLAGILAAVTIGVAAGGMASFSASQEDTQLQISDDEKDEAAEEDKDADDDAAQAGESETEFPVGDIAKADLVDVTDEVIKVSKFGFKSALIFAYGRSYSRQLIVAIPVKHAV